MMKELLALERELKEIKDQGNKKITEYQAKINVAMENEEEANRAVIKAKQGEDPKSYDKAIENKRMAINIASYYEGKIEALKDDPFITEAEYKDYTKRIKAAMDTINNEGKAKASKLFIELEAIKDDLKPSYNKANELLGQLQNNLYKADYNKVMSQAREQGTPINSSMLKNEYKDNSLIRSIDHILNSNAAETIKKEEVNND